MSVNPPKSWKNTKEHHLEVLDSEWYQIISKLQAQFVKSTVDFYNQKGLDFILLPITTGSISSPMGLGSDSSPVKVNIEGIDCYLADSMQFFLEFACRIHQKGCYYIAPSFRGEHADQRHLCQFIHSEAEIPGTLNEVIELVESYLHKLASDYLTHNSTDIKKICGRVDHIEKLKNTTQLPRVKLEEAIGILENNPKYINSTENFRTINKHGEKKLIEEYDGFVWLTHLDHLSVPFYQKAETNDYKTALCADLLMGIGETVGSGERHFSGKDVELALKRHKVDTSCYSWYIKMKDKVPLQTSGFGMGMERFLLWLINHDDIRDIQIIPRFNGQENTL